MIALLHMSEATSTKRWARLASFLLFLALCASVAAWTAQWLKPAPRPVAAAPRAEAPVTVQLDAASALFGRPNANVPPPASYALRGIVVARTPGDSVAVLALDGKPAQAVRVGAEVMPGVMLKEVHPRFVLLAEAGNDRRVDLPEKASGAVASAEAQQRTNAVEMRPQPAQTTVTSEVVSPRERRQRANRNSD